MLRKKILVLEGPAGAGKSRAIGRFHQYHPEVPVLERRKEVNGFRLYDSEYWPLTLDVDYIITALFCPADVFLVDRMWINSLVYQPFRYPVPGYYGDAEKYPTPEVIQTALGRLAVTAKTLMDTALIRDWNIQVPADFHISYHILLPHRDILILNRQMAGKEFPFDPAVETQRYLRVALNWTDQTAGPVRVTMNKHTIYTYQDYHEVQREMDRELEGWRTNDETVVSG